MQRALAKGLLVVAGLALGMVTGVEMYSRMVDMPIWFAQPPTSFELWRMENAASRIFWIPAQAIILITLVSALVLNWRTPRRRFIVGTLGLFVALFIAGGVYFLPQVTMFLSIPSHAALTPDLAEQVQRWLVLEWVRVAAFVLADTLLLIALLTPLQRTMTQKENIPLNSALTDK